MNTTEDLMRIMQKDLSAFFGLKGEVVKREMPTYDLVVTDTARFNALITTDGKWTVSWNDEDPVHQFKNVPVNELLPWLKSRIISLDKALYFDKINERVNVSFELEAQVSDRESIKRGLQKLGMDLRLSKKVMNVLEISEGH